MGINNKNQRLQNPKIELPFGFHNRRNDVKAGKERKLFFLTTERRENWDEQNEMERLLDTGRFHRQSPHGLSGRGADIRDKGNPSP